jgi:hypothetical protein
MYLERDQILKESNKYLDKNGKLISFNLKKNTILVKNILDYTKNIPDNDKIPISDLLWCIEHNYNKPSICKNCKKRLKFKLEKSNKKRGWYVQEFCNLKCSNTDANLNNIRKENIRKTTNTALEKRKQTIISKYGSWDNRPGNNNFENRRIKESINPELKRDRILKIKSSFYSKHGTEWNQKHLQNYQFYNDKDFIKANFIKNKKIDIFKFMKFFNCSISQPYNKFKKLGISYNKKNKFSLVEKELVSIIKDIYPNIILLENDKSFGIEVDILIPEYNLAIEFNGSYWHSFGLSKIQFKDKYKMALLKKTRIMENNNFNLLHVPEYQFVDPIKRDIWISIIKNKLKKNSKRYFARKLKIRQIDNKELKNFLNENHLQGYIGASIKLGLIDANNNIISVMTFSKSRYQKEIQYELIRFSSLKYSTCVGCATKLFKYFVINYSPKTIISYANRLFAYDKYNIYSKLGFEKIGETSPNFIYLKNTTIINRIQFQKHKLKNIPEFRDKLENFEKLTEEEIVLKNNYRKFYDVGNLKFIWRNQND